MFSSSSLPRARPSRLLDFLLNLNEVAVQSRVRRNEGRDLRDEFLVEFDRCPGDAERHREGLTLAFLELSGADAYLQQIALCELGHGD